MHKIIVAMFGAVVLGMVAGGTAGRAEEARSATAKNEEKLDAIRIPAMEIKDISLREAIGKIHRAAAEAEAGGPKGINIVLKLGEEAASRITVSFPGGTLREALGRVAAAGKCKVKVEPYAVSVIPLGEFTDEFFTRKYPAGSTFVRTLDWGDGRSLKETLEASGIEFPPGSSAVLLASGEVIIRNSEANLKAFEDLMARKNR